MDTKPLLLHKTVFWFLLATLSMAIPEVGTWNDPIPWGADGDWIIGYPVYGLQILFLSGIMFRWPIAGYRTLLAYGAIFGLYEAYITKMLWQPDWGGWEGWSIGGVHVLSTHLCVFWVHPVMAYVLPLVLCELLAVRPGRLSACFPAWMRRNRGRAALWLLVALGVYFGLGIGHKLSTRAMVVIPAISVAVVMGTGTVWRLVLRGYRFRLEELVPGKVGLVVVGILLAAVYGILGRILRAEFMPTAWLPHLIIWGFYAFFIAVIVLVTRHARPGPTSDVPTFTHRRALALSVAAVAALLGTAWLQATHTLPGEPFTVITYVLGGVANLLLLWWCFVRGLWQELHLSASASSETAKPVEGRGLSE